MKLIVNPHKIEIIKDEAVNEREIDISKCTFEFAEEITQEYVKEAYFTYNGETYKQIISNNECVFPSEVLEQKGMVEIGVVAYLVENEQEIKRYNPSPAYFNTLQGSLRSAKNSEPITPSEMEQFEQQLQEGLNSIDAKIDEVDTKMETVDTKIDEIDTAIEETNNLDLDVNKQNNKTTVTLTKKNGSTKSVDVLDGTDGQDGTSLEFMWQGTSLGIKTDDMQDYVFVDLQGIQGPVGETGAPFTIKKTYSSIAEMNADFDNMKLGDYVMIASSVELEDNAKLFTKGESAWIFITDFSGAMGIRGETGLTPNIQIGTVVTGGTSSVTRTGTNENPILNFVLEKGEKGNTGSTGPQGETGNGIASVTKTSTSGLTDTYTITYTNGNTSTFNVKNGKGISSIVKTSTSGLVDTYTVTFNDNTTMTYTVTNGKDGIDGEVTQEQLDQVIKDLEYWKTTNNALPKVQDEGTDITLNNTADSPLSLGFKASDTTQFTTNGYQLFDKDNANILNATFFETKTLAASTNGKTLYISCKPNTTYTINKTSSQRFRVLTTEEEPNIGVIGIQYMAGFTETTQIITTDSNANYLCVYYYLNGTDTKTEQEILDSIMIYEGLETLPYEPYTGGQPSPNPDYPQKIQVVEGDNEVVVLNKNIYDGEYETGGYDSTTGEKVTNNTQYRNKNFIPVKPNLTYIFSMNEVTITEQPRYFFYDKNKTFISSSVLTGTFTTPNNCYYVNWHSSGLKTNYPNGLVKPMIAENNQSIYYAEHKEQNLTLNLGVRNLFDKDNANIINAYLGNGKIVSSNSARCIYVPCEPNTTYTVSKLKGNRFAVAYCETEPQINANASIIQDNNATHITITNNDTGNYLVVWFYSGTYDTTISEQEMMSSVQIEEGPIAHSYSPYGQEPIEMCNINNYADEFFKNVPECEYYDDTLEIGKWYKYGRIGKIILDGSENWEIPSTNAYSLPKNQIINANLPTNTITNYIVNNFTKVEYPDTFVIGTCRVGGSYINFNFDDSNSNLNNFKIWVSKNKIIIYYILSEPTKTLLSSGLQQQLNDIEYAMAYQDQTNISQVNEDRPFIISASTIKDMKTLEDRITTLEQSISL